MNIEGKYLITTDNWFYAPDGKKYRAVWGDVSLVNDDALGIKTNRNSSNWYAYIGGEDKGVVVAGCQIHYAVKSNEKPNTGKVDEVHYDGSNSNLVSRESEIYIAE